MHCWPPFCKRSVIIGGYSAIIDPDQGPPCRGYLLKASSFQKGARHGRIANSLCRLVYWHGLILRRRDVVCDHYRGDAEVGAVLNGGVLETAHGSGDICIIGWLGL